MSNFDIAKWWKEPPSGVPFTNMVIFDLSMDKQSYAE